MIDKQKNFSHLSEEQQKKIQTSINASLVKYKEVRIANRIEADKRKLFRAKYHEGNEYLKKEFTKEDVTLGSFELYKDCWVSYVLIPTDVRSNCKDKTHCTLGYCIKAPLDKFIKHIAAGLCGYQIKHCGKYAIRLHIPDIMLIGTIEIHEIIQSLLKSRILLFAPKTPQRVINDISKRIKKTSS